MLDMEVTETINIYECFSDSSQFVRDTQKRIVLTGDEAKIIADLLKTKIKVLETRLDKYNRIIETGEETETDKNILGETQTTIETVETFINLTYNQLIIKNDSNNKK